MRSTFTNCTSSLRMSTALPQPPLWRDTLNLPIAHADGTPSVSHVLLDFRDPIIRGTFLFHCHLLEHEDGGMMAKIVVQ